MDAHNAALWVGLLLGALVVALYLLRRMIASLERDRITRDERAAYLKRIRYLEEEIRKIKGSIPFQIFHRNGKTGT